MHTEAPGVAVLADVLIGQQAAEKGEPAYA